MSKGVTVKIFLADGTPDGLKIVEKSNWTGIGVMCSRSQYPDVQNRSEFDGPGVYVLLGPSDSGNQSAIYIGEADIARSRLNQHLRSTDFWTSFILFTSKDANLNKAHVRYLESRLVGIALKAKRAYVHNGNTPGLAKLSEANQADIESFLADMLVIYPLLGVSAFALVETIESQTSSKLFLKGKETNAFGREITGGFVVYSGSLARLGDTPTLHNFVKVLRQNLLESGVLLPQKNQMLLTQDYRFDSPSTAAAAMLGRNANGRIEWKDEQGRTLKEIQSAAIESPSASQTMQDQETFLSID